MNLYLKLFFVEIYNFNDRLLWYMYVYFMKIKLKEDINGYFLFYRNICI